MQCQRNSADPICGAPAFTEDGNPVRILPGISDPQACRDECFSHPQCNVFYVRRGTCVLLENADNSVVHEEGAYLGEILCEGI